jgi:PPOX class probable F420-dependent enzyme
MTLLTPAARAAIDGGHLGHLVTLDPDGTPEVTLVWIGLDGDQVVAAHLGRYRKVRNMQRDGRVALSIETGVPGPNGLDEYLVVHGTATIVEGGAVEVLRRLSAVYLGPDVPTPLPPDPPPGYVTRISIERITGTGPWSTAGGPPAADGSPEPRSR